VTEASPFFIGTSGWSYSEWQTLFYPQSLNKKEWLHYYAKHFKVVEINATYYRLFPENVFVKWYKAAPNGFVYIVKVPQLITHKRKLVNCQTDIAKFCASVSLLKDKLGLILLQLPPNMPYDLTRLKEALLLFTDPTKVVVECRNPTWITANTKALLTEIGSIFCITDSPIILLKRNWLTAEIAYIRLHGRHQWYDYNYSHAELKNIARLAINMQKQGAKQVYILFNNDMHAYAPENALLLQSYLANATRY
jgi:uncharacterized protein YecE (DUF72 family)